MLRYITLAIISVMIVSVMIPGSSVFALTDSQRYSSGYNHGCSDGKRGGHYYLTGSGGASSHTSIFMRGYNDGYSSCSDVNKAGIDWRDLCNKVQFALYQSCSTLVSPSNTLTSQGEKAFECIKNGALLGGAAKFLGAPVDWILSGLDALSKPTGCDGIVNMQSLRQSVGTLDSILGILG